MSDEEPPSPVASVAEEPELSSTGSSRLFSPYRSVGIVSSGAPFHLVSHERSSMVCVPIGDRFQILSTDKLDPILVSRSSAGEEISQCVTDASLRISVVLTRKGRQATLFSRTESVKSVNLASKEWEAHDMLHLGKLKMNMDGEKEGTIENVALIAVVLRRSVSDTKDTVPVVGEDEEDGDDLTLVEDDDDCRGVVVLLVAGRKLIRVQKRIRLTMLPDFEPMTAVHPVTYVNKICIGGCRGDRSSLILLNIRSGQLVHTFECLGNSRGKVTCIAQSPAVDTVAVGTDGGTVQLINLRHDKRLFTLSHSIDGDKSLTIQAVSFRSDASALQYGIAPMAVARSDGTITIWDLTAQEDGQRSVLTEMKHVHPGGIASMQYLPQEPVLLSSGSKSNSIIMHIFDNPDHSARHLRSRRGHTAPPSLVRYLHPGAGASILANVADGTDASSCQILSTGGPDRRLRVFSTARSVLDKEYSQGAGLEKKAKKYGVDTAELLLPPVTGLAVCESRSRDWGDLVTMHKDHAFCYVWSSRRGAQSGPLLKQPKWKISSMAIPPPRGEHATSVALSSCGNFCVVGTRGGTIYKYNVQSGTPRGSYPSSSTTTSCDTGKRLPGDIQKTMKSLEKGMKMSNRRSNLDKKDTNAEQKAQIEARRHEKLKHASHTGAVTGVAIDSVNKVLVSVGQDAKLILWQFATHSPHRKSPYELPAPAVQLSHLRDSDLAGIALSDFSVLLFDCEALAIVRRFGVGHGHTAPISDLGFSPDGRSLFTASLDRTIRVWDVPTNSCVDWLSFRSAPTSLTLSPTGEFLATSHEGQVGLSIWSDRTFYQTVHMDGTSLDTPFGMDEPAPIGDSTKGYRAPASPPHAVPHDEEEVDDGLVEPKDAGLITMSGLPPSRWKTLFHLELVKERNKPKEAPKKPPSAPFFLQWRSGEAMASSTPDNASGKDDKTDDEAWAAAWSDDDDNDGDQSNGNGDSAPATITTTGVVDRESLAVSIAKRRKTASSRSLLAAVLARCSDESTIVEGCRYGAVTDHIRKLGPSAIDVEIASLCRGSHDLEEGLDMMYLACMWLLEACEQRDHFETVNAYLHRFLHLHATTIASIEESFASGESVDTKEEHRKLLDAVKRLRTAQRSATEALNGKLQQTLCLLRHFSRMV